MMTSSQKRKLEATDAQPQIGFSFPQHNFANLSQQKDNSFLCSSEVKRRRQCWEGDHSTNQAQPPVRNSFSISPTSAFNATNGATIQRTPLAAAAAAALQFQYTPYNSSSSSVSAHQYNISSSFGQTTIDEGDTDHDSTPASLMSRQQQLQYQQSAHSLNMAGLSMDIEEDQEAMSSQYNMDCDNSNNAHDNSQCSSWFDRIKRASTKSSKTAENVLFTSRHYVFPPASSANTAAASTSCMYCLRQYSTGPPTTYTYSYQSNPTHTNSQSNPNYSSGGYLSCNYCDRMCCAETCLRSCEQCHGLFCGVCSTTDYSAAFEQYLCLDCYQR